MQLLNRVRLFETPMDRSMPGFPVLHYLPEFAQVHVHWVSDAMQPSHPLPPLFLFPSIFPIIRGFSNEVTLCIRWWPKYWSFSISPSNEYSELISFRIDWLIFLAVPGTLKEFSSTKFWKHQFFSAQTFLWSSSHIHTWLLEKSQFWLYRPLSSDVSAF